MTDRFCSTSGTETLPTGARVRYRFGTILHDLETPCYIPPSVVGILPFITPDNYSKLPEFTTQVVDYADISTFVDFAKEKETPLRDFMRLRGSKLVLSARDYINQSNPPTKKGMFIMSTGKGRREVKPSDLMTASAALGAEIVVPLADEIALSFGSNRQRTAVQSTLNWLDACLSKKHEDDNALVCGVIVGGADERLRRMSAEETAKRDVQALVLSGLELLDDDTQRQSVIDSVLDAVAPTPGNELPRFVTGVGHPLSILKAVASGADAFISTYPASATQAHTAFAFWVDPTKDDTRVRSMERERSGSVLYLREKRFEKDFAPLMVDCECYTCRHYTRAYVHHLLNVKEMLGDTLLYLHNMHYYYIFFRTIRNRIADGTYLAFMEEFAAKYEERESQAPPLAVPLAIVEKQEKKDAERVAREEKKAAHAAEMLQRVKAKAAEDAAVRALVAQTEAVH